MRKLHDGGFKTPRYIILRAVCWGFVVPNCGLSEFVERIEDTRGAPADANFGRDVLTIIVRREHRTTCGILAQTRLGFGLLFTCQRRCRPYRGGGGRSVVFEEQNSKLVNLELHPTNCLHSPSGRRPGRTLSCRHMSCSELELMPTWHFRGSSAHFIWAIQGSLLCDCLQIEPFTALLTAI